MSLIFRGKKFHNESVEDYLDRVAYRNGFLSRGRFVGWLKDVYDESYGDVWWSDGAEWNMHHMRWYKCIYALELICNRSISVDNTLSKFGLFNTRPKLCEECWHDEAYVRCYWHLPKYRQCHIHGSRLKKFKGYGRGWRDLTLRASYAVEFENFTDYFTCQLVEKYADQEACLEHIFVELYNVEYELVLLKWLDRFVRSYLGYELEKEQADKMCLSGELIGAHVSARLEGYIKAMAIGDLGKIAELLLALVALRIKGVEIKYARSYCAVSLREFNDWANSQIFSNSNLLSACIKGEAIAERLEGNVRGYTQPLTRELSDEELIAAGGEYQLGQYIFRTKLRNPYGSNEKDDDVKAYQKKIKRRNGTYDSAFSKFLEDSGYNVLTSPELEV